LNTSTNISCCGVRSTRVGVAGLDQAAAVLELAVRICPAEGAGAEAIETTVVADLTPEAVLSSESLESLPWQKVPLEVPKAGRECLWSERAREVAVPSEALSPGAVAPAVAVDTSCL